MANRIIGEDDVPMGPYVHFNLTRMWACEIGLCDVADRIARADIEVDREHPARSSLRSWSMHFAPVAHLWTRRYLRCALRERSPEMLGRALHSAQDGVAHGSLGMGHLRYDLGIARNPDDWAAASESVRELIRIRSLRLLRRYRDSA